MNTKIISLACLLIAVISAYADIPVISGVPLDGKYTDTIALLSQRGISYTVSTNGSSTDVICKVASSPDGDKSITNLEIIFRDDGNLKRITLFYADNSREKIMALADEMGRKFQPSYNDQYTKGFRGQIGTQWYFIAVQRHGNPPENRIFYEKQPGENEVFDP